jgi:glycosyltransferase involved in cell wall biosynthesis
MKGQTHTYVGLTAHLLSMQAGYRRGGIHNYIQQLIRHLADADPSQRYLVFTGRTHAGQQRQTDQGRISWQVSRWPTERPWVRVVWEQAVQPWAVRRSGVHLLHSLAFVSPMLSSVPAVITVHDLSFLRFPERFRPANRLYLSTMTRLSCQRARRVIAVSQATADEIVRLLRVSPARIDVIPHGVEHDRFQPVSAAQLQSFRREKDLPERFILYLGTLEPRKNILDLLEAYSRTRAIRQAVPLVLAGGKGWYYEEIFARVERLGLTDAVRFPGFVPDAEIPLWYNAATVFVYPSLYEGFGLPLLEAMACGTPVIGSATSSIPEVVQGAGLLVAPGDVDELCDSLDRVVQDRNLRADLGQLGRARSSSFTWQATAAATAASYRRALSQSEE